MRTVVVEPYKLTQYVRRELIAKSRSGRKTTSVPGCHLHRIMFDDIVLLFLLSWNKSDRLRLQLSYKIIKDRYQTEGGHLELHLPHEQCQQCLRGNLLDPTPSCHFCDLVLSAVCATGATSRTSNLNDASRLHIKIR